jgi:hypothetical protein
MRLTQFAYGDLSVDELLSCLKLFKHEAMPQFMAMQAQA